MSATYAQEKQSHQAQSHKANNTELRKPTWWNESFETSWQKVKVTTLEGWDKLLQRGQKLNHRIAEQALAFGHGARELYPKITAWSKELEDKLKADWAQIQGTAEETWEKVSDAIKHGWETAKQPKPPKSPGNR